MLGAVEIVLGNQPGAAWAEAAAVAAGIVLLVPGAVLVSSAAARAARMARMARAAWRFGKQVQAGRRRRPRLLQAIDPVSSWAADEGRDT